MSSTFFHLSRWSTPSTPRTTSTKRPSKRWRRPTRRRCSRSSRKRGRRSCSTRARSATRWTWRGAFSLWRSPWSCTSGWRGRLWRSSRRTVSGWRTCSCAQRHSTRSALSPCPERWRKCDALLRKSSVPLDSCSPSLSRRNSRLLRSDVPHIGRRCVNCFVVVTCRNVDLS